MTNIFTNIKKFLTNYQKAVLPPYQQTDLPPIAFSVLILIALLLTINTLQKASTNHQSYAQTPNNIVEPENGTISGNIAIVNDPNASGGQYVLLGANISTPSATPSPISTLNLYVSLSGSDTNPGTQTAPFRTIQKAANIVTAGYTVHVSPGTYNEIIHTTKNGTAAAPIKFVSDTKWGAKIIANSNSSDVWVEDGDYVNIDGFDVSAAAYPSIREGIYVQGSGVRITNNIVHDIPAVGAGKMGGTCIGSNNYGGYSGTADLVIDSNIVHDCGNASKVGYYVNGIYPSAPAGHGVITNNIVYRIESCGIHLNHNPANWIVANNLVFKANYCAFYLGGEGYIASNNTFANNIAVDSNTAFMGNSNTTGSKWINNLIWNNSRDGSPIGSVSGTIKADPLFINYQSDGSGDYHLKAGSPAIDSASALYAPSADFDGKARPQGAGYDIGPYEY